MKNKPRDFFSLQYNRIRVHLCYANFDYCFFFMFDTTFFGLDKICTSSRRFMRENCDVKCCCYILRRYFIWCSGLVRARFTFIFIEVCWCSKFVWLSVCLSISLWERYFEKRHVSMRSRVFSFSTIFHCCFLLIKEISMCQFRTRSGPRMKNSKKLIK